MDEARRKMIKVSANTEEQPTGKTISIEVCLNPGEKDEKKQKWKKNLPN